MAKANQKAIAIKNFDLATTGIIYHPPMDVIEQCEKDSKIRKRNLQKRLNIAKFQAAPKFWKILIKSRLPYFVKREQQIQKGKDLAKAWQ